MAHNNLFKLQKPISLIFSFGDLHVEFTSFLDMKRHNVSLSTHNVVSGLITLSSGALDLQKNKVFLRTESLLEFYI